MNLCFSARDYSASLFPKVSAQARIFAGSTLLKMVLPSIFQWPPKASVATTFTFG